MYCTNCGSEVKEGNTFCTNCGAKLGKDNIKIEQKKKIILPKNKKIIFIPLVILLVVILVTFTIYRINKNKAENLNTKESNVEQTEEVESKVQEKKYMSIQDVYNDFKKQDIQKDVSFIEVRKYPEDLIILTFCTIPNTDFIDEIGFITVQEDSYIYSRKELWWYGYTDEEELVREAVNLEENKRVSEIWNNSELAYKQLSNIETSLYIDYFKNEEQTVENIKRQTSNNFTDKMFYYDGNNETVEENVLTVISKEYSATYREFYRICEQYGEVLLDVEDDFYEESPNSMVFSIRVEKSKIDEVYNELCNHEKVLKVIKGYLKNSTAKISDSYSTDNFVPSQSTTSNSNNNNNASSSTIANSNNSTTTQQLTPKKSEQELAKEQMDYIQVMINPYGDENGGYKFYENGQNCDLNFITSLLEMNVKKQVSFCIRFNGIIKEFFDDELNGIFRKYMVEFNYNIQITHNETGKSQTISPVADEVHTENFDLVQGNNTFNITITDKYNNSKTINNSFVVNLE